MLSNHPNALGGGSTSSAGGEAGVFSNVLVGNGSATAPSYSFTSDPMTGLYLDSSHVLGWTFNGVEGAMFAGGASGGLTITAKGTNQSITLTPSGTGLIVLSNANTGQNVGSLQSTSASGLSAIGFLTSAGSDGGSFGYSNSSAAAFTGATFLNAGSGKNLVFGVGGVEKFRLSLGGNLLLGGLTTDGTGVLQLPNHSSTAGGISFGTGAWLSANSSGGSQINCTGGFYSTGNIIAQNQYISNSAGTPTNPAFGQTNYGMYFPGGTATAFSANNAVALTLDSLQNTQLAKKVTSYNGIATAGWGMGAVQAAAEVTAQAAANASIATYTVGAADGTFRVSAQLDCTAATVLSTTLQCTYTDKSNTARTMIFPIQQLTGSFIAGGLISGTGAWETPVMHIRCKAATAITILTATGTFSGVTYSADAVIEQVA